VDDIPPHESSSSTVLEGYLVETGYLHFSLRMQLGVSGVEFDLIVTRLSHQLLVSSHMQRGVFSILRRGLFILQMKVNHAVGDVRSGCCF
jgi:hypothetical protein